MRFLATTALLCFGPVALADEIVLKDGKKIEWVSLRVKGESYEVETPDGKQLTIKRSDVQKLAMTSGPEIAPLTGAAVAKDKKKLVTVDLLQGIDVKRDTVQGEWKIAKGALVATHTAPNNAKFQLKSQPFEEFDLSLVIERKDAGRGDFVIGLTGGGAAGQFEIILDGATGRSGLFTSAGLNDPEATAPGALLPLGVQRKITVLVRKTGVLLKADDQEVVVWVGDWSKLVVPPVHAVPSRDAFFFCCSGGQYEVSRALLVASKN